ncbi:hypothetical protein [Lachnoclostridium sp.]|uniref:hypothetical protein n=1 Tax=Lachnoclostridium sp. TaxID=2028282 RepID=UPI00289B7B09|nr:hypothetical protein [Lachnoclostridium sp.]
MNDEVIRLKEKVEEIVQCNGEFIGVQALLCVLETFANDYPESNSIEELNDYIDEQFEPLEN